MRCRHLVCSFVALLLVVSTARTAAAEDVPGVKGKSVTVKTTQELVAAVASDTTVYLEPGTYVLGAAWIVKGVQNLTLVGKGEPLSAHIIMPDESLTVLTLHTVKGVTLKNLKMGHDPKTDLCWANVIDITDGADITIEGCDLYGSGLIGLGLKNVQGLQATNTTIRDCSYNIMEVHDSKGIVFDTGSFLSSGAPNVFDIATSEITMKGIRIEGNTSSWNEKVLFKVVDSKVTLVDCIVTGNQADYFELTQGSVTLDPSTKIDWSQFAKGKAAK